MFKIFFSGQKELEVFLFQIVCKMFFFIQLDYKLEASLVHLLYVFFFLQRRALELKSSLTSRVRELSSKSLTVEQYFLIFVFTKGASGFVSTPPSRRPKILHWELRASSEQVAG